MTQFSHLVFFFQKLNTLNSSACYVLWHSLDFKLHKYYIYSKLQICSFIFGSGKLKIVFFDTSTMMEMSKKVGMGYGGWFLHLSGLLNISKLLMLLFLDTNWNESTNVKQSPGWGSAGPMDMTVDFDWNGLVIEPSPACVIVLPQSHVSLCFFVALFTLQVGSSPG